jgi:hypothetical protein
MLKFFFLNKTARAAFLVCTILLAVFFILSIQSFLNSSLLPIGIFTYDEADYMFAADKGFVANYLDSGSQTIFSFISTGLKAGRDKSGWSQLSRSVRGSNDICFYRHFHGPLYYYWLIAAKRLGFSPEVRLRYASFLLLFICTIAMVIIAAKLYPSQFMAPSLLVGFALLVSPSSILTTNHLTPHALYMVFSLLCVGCAAIYCKTSQEKYWYFSLIAASLSFMTMEYTAFLLFSLLCTLVLQRESLFQKSRKETQRFFLISGACFFAPLAALWPGGMLKLSFVKGYLFLAYLILTRPETYGNLSLKSIWVMRIRESPMEYLLLATVIVVSLFIIKKRLYLMPPLIYSLCILVTALRNNSPVPQYFSSLFPPLYLIGVAEIIIFCSGIRRGILTILFMCTSLAFVLNLYFFLKIAPTSLQRMRYEVTSLNDLRRIVSDTTPIFMDRMYVPVAHYYFPRSTIIGYSLERENSAAIFEEMADALKQKHDKSQQVTLIWNRNDLAFSQQLGRRFSINSSRELIISETAPHAVAYNLSLKQLSGIVKNSGC